MYELGVSERPRNVLEPPPPEPQSLPVPETAPFEPTCKHCTEPLTPVIVSDFTDAVCAKRFVVDAVVEKILVVVAFVSSVLPDNVVDDIDVLPETVSLPCTSASPVVVAPPEIVSPPLCVPLPMVVDAIDMSPPVNDMRVLVDSPYVVMAQFHGAVSVPLVRTNPEPKALMRELLRESAGTLMPPRNVDVAVVEVAKKYGAAIWEA